MEKGKNIIIYYQSLRTFLIYKEILEEKPYIFDTVIKMPFLPYSRKSNKRNYKKLIITSIENPGYFIIQFLNIYIYNLISFIFKTRLEDICKNKKINHIYFEKIDSEFLKFIKGKNPNYIVNTTSSLIPIDLLKTPKIGVINLHEAPLPEYRGSALYFWLLFNKEKKAHVTCHYVQEELDAGDIICAGPSVKISKSNTIFFLWKSLLLSYKNLWPKIIEYLFTNKRLESYKQNNNRAKTYSYPNKIVSNYLKNNKIKIVSFNDIKFLLKVAITGKL